MKFKILVTLFLIFTINKITYPSTSAPIKIIATIVDKEDSIFENVEENIYHALIENKTNTEIIFNSKADIQSFPTIKLLKPGDKQLFKFIAKDKNSIKLFYELNNKKNYIKTYNDLEIK
ncbi:hypothetical protein [Cetobacterium sp.]|uniref:hypothetical protein n=1 Tax=Cetobacterium sp. TaxID=2071632 RepID=UPI003F406B10